MPSSLDIIPQDIPALPPGVGRPTMPRHMLERPPDATGFLAARIAWCLYQGSQQSHGTGQIRTSITTLRHTAPGVSIHCIEDRPYDHTRGAALALFDDLSALILRSVEPAPWPGCLDESRCLAVLPIVFRLTPMIDTRAGIAQPRFLPLDGGLDFSFVPEGHDRAISEKTTLFTHLDDEVRAWARWLDRLPGLNSPEPFCDHQTVWPSFFPNTAPAAETLHRLETHARDSMHAVFAHFPHILHGHVSIHAPYRLQGGKTAPRVNSSWAMSDHVDRNRIQACLEYFLFRHPDSIAPPCAQILRLDGEAGFARDSFLLGEIHARNDLSTHARIQARARFHLP